MLNRRSGYSLAMIAISCLLGACLGADENKAKIRVINASLDYDSIDLYIDGERKQASIAYATDSGYLELDEDTYTVAFANNGSTSKLESFSESLAEETHKTYVAYGRSGSFATFEIDEDQGAADSGEAKLLVLNTATDAGPVDVYLTGADAALSDASPVISDLEAGTAADYTTVSSGTYRLRIVAAGSTTDIRLDASDFSMGSTSVRALIVTDTIGGVLVNAMALSQQGSLVLQNNANARIRAAVGITNGASVTASIGDINLLTGATAVAIGSYKQINATSSSVALSVDGNEVAVSDQTLSAGGDYTLLIWDDASSSTQVTLLSDDNRLPLNRGSVKLRLVNVMSGLSDPITLAVDFSPVAENLAQGQASPFTELSSSSDSRLDVTNVSTAATLFTQTATSLLEDGVYSMFMFGDISETTGRLRKER